jgi:hypothetical protein
MQVNRQELQCIGLTHWGMRIFGTFLDFTCHIKMSMDLLQQSTCVNKRRKLFFKKAFILK